LQYDTRDEVFVSNNNNRITQPLAYVHWLDANYQEGEQEIERLDWRCALHYSGYLIKEDENAVTLSLECPHEGRTRNTFTIPRHNIIEMRVVPFNKAFPAPRKKRPAPAASSEPAA
jgi:hypothetical protein